MSIKKPDQAVQHFVESGSYLKAVVASISAKQWRKAASHFDSIPVGSAESEPAAHMIAVHFAAIGDHKMAERFYMLASKPSDAVEMYTKSGEWEKAYSIAKGFMELSELRHMYQAQAHALILSGMKVFIYQFAHSLLMNDIRQIQAS